MPVWDTDRNQESVFNDAIVCVVFGLCFPKFSEVLWVNSENLGVMIHRKQSFLVWNLFWSNVVPTWRKLTHFQLRYEKHTVLPRKSFKSCRQRHLNHNLCARCIRFILLLNLFSVGSVEGQYWIVSFLPSARILMQTLNVLDHSYLKSPWFKTFTETIILSFVDNMRSTSTMTICVMLISVCRVPFGFAKPVP